MKKVMRGDRGTVFLVDEANHVLGTVEAGERGHTITDRIVDPAIPGAAQVWPAVVESEARALEYLLTRTANGR